MGILASVVASNYYWILRHWLQLVMVGLSLAIMVDSFIVKGLFLPVRIVGASMAETLCGEHLELTCPQCGWPFKVDAVGPGPNDEFAICLRCEKRDVPYSTARRMNGDRVYLDQFTPQVRGWRRWEVVAVREPGNEKRLVVKRIVGLPGERIKIRDGKLFADGKLLVKSPEEESAMFVEVVTSPPTDAISYNQFRRGEHHPVDHTRTVLKGFMSPIDVVLHEIQIRDLYYLDPRGGTADWEMAAPLGPGEYFLLGDNPIASIDSRHWPRNANEGDFVGRIVKP